MKQFWIPISILVLLGYSLSGIYSVGLSQRGVQTFLGRPATMPKTPGLHIHAPWPIGSVTLVDVSKVRSDQIRFEWPNEKGHRCYLLTGDENIIELELQVHYVVSNSIVFIYINKDPSRLLAMAARASAVSILSQMTVDGALTIGRPIIAAKLKNRLNHAISGLLGIRITSVLITKLTPPVQVRSAFAAVASAKADQARRINDAFGDRNRQIPRARANSGRILSTAQAKAKELLESTKGWLSTYQKSLLRYRAAPLVTKSTLLNDELPRILGRTHLVLVDPSKVSTVFMGGLPPPYNQGVLNAPKKAGK